MVFQKIPSLTTILILISFITLAYSQKQIIDIHYADFSQNQDSLQLNGEALFRTDDLGNKVVTVVPCSTYSSGSIFYKTPVSLLDPSGNGVSFSAFFRFRMPNADGAIDADGSGADGVVFVVQTVSNNVGNVGSGMGFENIPRSVGIEFDTYNNGYKDKDNGNHIGIDIAGSTNSIKTINMPKRLNDGDIWCAWVDYSGLTQILEVRFDSINVRPTNPLISDTLNLLNILGSNDAYFGFTAATGAGFANHDIIELRFINEFQPIKKNLINDSVYTVNEDEVNGYIVGDISKDSLYKFEYLFPQNPIKDFAIDSFTGEITVQSSSGLNYKIDSLYQFDIVAIAYDTLSADLVDTIFDTAQITIHIKEISIVENFIDDQSFNIKDTASVSSLVGTILTQNSTYDSLIILNNNSEFNINSNNLDITVSSSAKLDYDSISQYTFKVVAQKQYYSNDTALITINIEDVIFISNLIDNKTFTIYDSISPGSFVGLIDTNISVDTLITINIAQEFKFDIHNLSISTNNSTILNADSVNYYEFKIIAKKNSFQNDTATISINILKFINNINIISDQSFTVPEDILPGNIIGTVNFHLPPDSLIILNSFPEFSYLENNSNFILNMGQKLKFEKTNKYIYTVIAQKQGYLNDTAQITINIENVIYSQNFVDDQTFTIFEDIQPGSFIGSINYISIPDTLLFIITDSLICYDYNNNAISVDQNSKFEYDIIKSISYKIIAKKEDYYNDTAFITIKIKEVNIPSVKYSGYYDFNANGTIDSIMVEFDSAFNYPSQVHYSLSWLNNNQKPVIVSQKNIGNKLYLAIKEDSIIKTSGRLFLNIKDNSNGDSTQIEIDDKAAPVLNRAIYSTGKDKKSKLITSFSEEIEYFSSNSPFKFYRNSDSGNITYEILINNTKTDGDNISWHSKIDSILKVQYVYYRDSLNIYPNNQIKDKNGNYQNNIRNRIVELEIAESEYEIDVSLITPFNPSKTIIPDKFKQHFNNTVSTGTIINVNFNSQLPLNSSDLKCSIYDVVGNLVSSCGGVDSITTNIKIERISEGREIAVYWDGRNNSQRLIGSGTYLIVLDIKPKKDIIINKKILVGVSN